MSSEEIEPDAWQRKDDAYYTYPPIWHAAVDTDYDKISRFKPLYSAETIKQLIKDKRAEFNNGRTSEYPQKVLTELLKEVEEA